MFTGIVEELATVHAVEQSAELLRLTFAATTVLQDVQLGDSIAVNGCCLTVVSATSHHWSADLMPATLERTTLGSLTSGDRVNCERALRNDARLGGHLVQGHVDLVARITERVEGAQHVRLSVTLPAHLRHLVVEQGSITLDGVSLTVVSVADDVVTVSLIPETLQRTTLGARHVGESLNVEVDMVAKHLHRFSSLNGLAAATRPAPLRLDPVERAIADIAAGKAVVVVDDDDRENEGDIIFAADAATPELMAFTVRHSSGVICVPMEGERLDALGIPLMTPENQDPLRTAYTVSVDAAHGVTTGISAADRAHTAQLLASPEATAADFTRPGHVFPLRYREGGVLTRRGHTEAAVDLARLAGRAPIGVLVEVVNDDGTMKRGEQLRAFADEHGLALISVEQLVQHRRAQEELQATRIALPTAHGEFTARLVPHADGTESLLLTMGHVEATSLSGTASEPLLVRVHSECLTGDVLGSLRCDCGPQLDASLERIAARGRGVVVYVKGHEGRGIGLGEKLRAYALQEQGLDTVDANLRLGHAEDERSWSGVARALSSLDIGPVTLLTNNPAKVDALRALGVDVRGVQPLVTGVVPENRHYLETKRDRMGHLLSQVPA